jgi:formiminotetrahydrofolate cyclodeaminase
VRPWVRIERLRATPSLQGGGSRTDFVGSHEIVRAFVMASENATQKDVEKVDKRVTDIVDQLNEINQNMKTYVDEANEEQAKTLRDVEKRLTDLIETKVKNYDKLVRKVVKDEFAKIGK